MPGLQVICVDCCLFTSPETYAYENESPVRHFNHIYSIGSFHTYRLYNQSNYSSKGKQELARIEKAPFMSASAFLLGGELETASESVPTLDETENFPNYS